MARLLTGQALEALIDECAEPTLDDPEIKLLMEELDKGISKLFADIKEANEDIRIIEEERSCGDACQSSSSIQQNDDIIFIGKVDSAKRQTRPELVKDMKVFAKRKKDDLWYDATILELLTNQLLQVKVKVKFDGKGSHGIFSCKHIALKNKLKLNELAVGSRIIAKYENDADISMKECLYAGIIAETPLPYNKLKFLVFFDDGFAQYMDCDQIYKVYEASKFVWEDVHEDSREFIKEYLDKYPERPMVRVTDGQVLKTEWKGSWWKTRVLKVHGSLVNMFFLKDERTEWIFRGSPRLEPLHRELMVAEASRQAGKVIRGTSHTVVKRNAPVVEYINVETPTLVNPAERSRQTARKSSKNRKMHRQKHQWDGGDRQWEMMVNKPNKKSDQEDNLRVLPDVNTESYVHSDLHTFDHKNEHGPNLQSKEDKSTGSKLQLAYESSCSENSGNSKKLKKLPSYENHNCSHLCVVPVKDQIQDLKDENPLRWPQIAGWLRELSGKRGSGKKTVFYRTPCMKRLRNLEDISTYLLQTDVKYLAIDNFTFDPFIYTIPRSAGRSSLWGKEAKVIIKDISHGAEMVPIMLVNEIDNERPDESYHYITYRKCKKTSINTDSNFLVCCDCTDNCKDRSKCACQQLTIDSTRASHDGKVDLNAGYKYRRLDEQLTTGIFECNSKCKCSKSCYNRVAQNGVRVRLQVFKTEKRGWGLRCIDDIQAGMFICTYAGNLWNEEEANDFGRKFGDEYFAELDYIEVVEKNKEGYESDVQSSEGYDSDSTESSCNSDADYRSYRTDSGGSSPYHTPSADEISLDEGYAATQTKSGTRIVLRRKSANSGTQSSKDSWSVVESPGMLSTVNKDGIIIISSDEEDCASLSFTASFNEAAECGKISKEMEGNVNNEAANDIVSKDVHKENKPAMKADKNEKEQDCIENTTNSSGLDYEDYPYLEKDLAVFYTGHTDDEEAEENIKKNQDEKPFVKENSPDTTVGGINYGYNVSPRQVLDRKAIIAYRERKKGKKRLKFSEDDKDAVCNIDDTNEGCGKDSSSSPSKSPIKVEDTHEDSGKDSAPSKPIINGANTNQPIIQKPNTYQSIAEKQTDAKESMLTAGPEIPQSLEEMKDTLSMHESELSSSDSEDEKTGMQSGDSSNRNKLRTAKKSTHTRLSLTKSPSYVSQKMASNLLKKEDNEGGDGKPSFSRTRSLFGEEEHCYVMDAKREGNLGRYFNHSCVPNLFVQNVFVDTHDLRFPWLAFFAGQNIRAGTELTWDYGYEVGSVANKTLYCYCASKDCRGRLL